MSLRGKAAIVGIGETAHRRVWPGRSMPGLCAEAAAMALEDAGLSREDIDGFMTYGGPVYPGPIAEYIGIRPIHFSVGAAFMGGSSGCALAIALNVVANEMADYVMFVGGGARDPANPAASIYMDAPGGAPPGVGTEWVSPFGPAAAANNTYGLLYTRHMYQYGTKQEQLAQMAVNQRFNALQNPRAAFTDPLTVEDVMNSRYINYPLHILDSVMPVAGAIAYIVTSPERAKALRKPPVYVLGAGVHQGYSNSWLNPNMLEVPVKIAAKSAYNMAGYGPKDMQFAEFYD